MGMEAQGRNTRGDGSMDGSIGMGVLGWEHGDGSMGTGEWEQEHVDGREGTGAYGLHFGDGSIITWRGEGLEIFLSF